MEEVRADVQGGPARGSGRSSTLRRHRGISARHLWRTELRSQNSSALVALISVPVDVTTTLGTAPPQSLLFGPRVKTDLPLPLDVLQDFTVMRKSVFAEVHQPLARRIRASAAVSENRCPCREFLRV